jgi:hypothetical protein
MSRRLMKSRNEDAMRRRGSTPLTLFILNREDFPDLPPLNTPSGQGFIDRLIERLGGIDCVFFDNVQSWTPPRTVFSVRHERHFGTAVEAAGAPGDIGGSATLGYRFFAQAGAVCAVSQTRRFML